MNIYSILQIGEYHQNYCEDYLFTDNLGERMVCAVMDGCTMAKDSYFISTLVGKLLRKIIKELSYEYWLERKDQVFSLEKYIKKILEALFIDLRKIKNELMLEDKEMLTTLILLVLDKDDDKGFIIVIGDGMASINGNVIDFEQDNKPDYLGFHLHENFEDWYYSQKQKIMIESIEDISIATDGIFTFSNVSVAKNDTEINPLEYLIKNTDMKEKKDMLYLKLKNIQHQYGMKPTDDLALIRIIR